MNKYRFTFILISSAILLMVCFYEQVLAEEKSTVWLSSLDLSKMTVGWGQAQADKSITGRTLSIGGVHYEKGVGSHATSTLYIALNKGTARFISFVGVDDDTEDPQASLIFKIYADKEKVYDSGLMKAADAAQKVDVDLKGVQILILTVNAAGNGIDYDHADWAMAKFEVTGSKPVAVDPLKEEEYILTPKPGPAPKINGPEVFGTRPGHPFIYRIPATGQKPMIFSAENLPTSMTLDAKTGIVTGTSPEKRGDYLVMFKAENSSGQDSRRFKLVVGDTLALTPPMGWNSWYIHYHRVTDADMRAAADAMIESGMADYGYMYVNIDDCWSKKKGDEPYRDNCGTILSNTKFPDMFSLTEYIHSKGLRAGIYTSPGPWNCAGYAGSYQHEQFDARIFAEWGFDFLKYDWCSYRGHTADQTRYEYVRPYALMGEILKNVGRDIVYNLCQYGMDNVWEWGSDVDGNCWRTTGDLGLMSGYLEVGLSNARHYEYAEPGRWNDPDYILIGWVGNAHAMGEGVKTTLTPNRQYQYMSMWSLMAAPLIFSGDMTKLDAFTLNILCNREVIDVDQDPLGKQGRIVFQNDEYFIMAKQLEDGSKAVGLFNTSEAELSIKASWEMLGLHGKHKIRDLWRQKDIGTFDNAFETNVPGHGVSLIRIGP